MWISNFYTDEKSHEAVFVHKESQLDHYNKIWVWRH